MNKRTILHAEFTLEYERTANGTSIELRLTHPLVEYEDWLCYGSDEDMTLKEICEEQLDELWRYMNAAPNADDFYDNFDLKTIRKFIEALEQIVKEEG